MSLRTVLTILLWLVWISYAVLIFILSSGDTPSALSGYPDKLLHLACYAVFELLLLNAFSRGFRNRLRFGILALSLLITVIFGATDELHQWFVPGRNSSYADLAADAVGGILGMTVFILLAHLLWRSRNPRDTSSPS